MRRIYIPLLHSSLNSPSPTLERAGLLPTFDLMYMYSRLHPNNSFYQILKVAAVIDDFPLALHEKYLFCISPAGMDDEISSQGLTQFAESYAKKGLVRLQEIFTPGTLSVPKTPSALKELESIHKVLDLSVWLSSRLEESFPDRELVSSQKAICSMLIEEFLERLGWQQPMARRLPSRKMSSSLLSQHMRPSSSLPMPSPQTLPTLVFSSFYKLHKIKYVVYF